jgi:hypothetical protein
VSPALDHALTGRDKAWRGSPAAPAATKTKAPASLESGRLEAGSVPRLLNAFYQAGHTGELRLKSGETTKAIYFQEGKPVFAASNVPTESLGRHAIATGAATREQVQKAAIVMKDQRLSAADALVKVGALTAERRDGLVQGLVKKIIAEGLTWATGDYTFSKRAPAQRLPAPLFTPDLILEGVSSTPVETLRAQMGPKRRLFPTADPPYGLHEIKLEGAQALLLAYSDGSKTVEDLLALTELNEQKALGTLRALELMGLLEERREDGKQRRISFGL